MTGKVRFAGLVSAMAVLLALCMALGASMAYSAEHGGIKDSGSCGSNVSWTLYDDGTLQISGSGAMSNYSSGEQPWFKYWADIKSVEVGEGVTSVGEAAFRVHSNIESVTLPSTLTSIGDYAFYECTSLTSVNIPEGLTVLNYQAFYGCSSLGGNITLPECLTTLGNEAFRGTAITSINIPSQISSLGAYAFGECTNLKSVEFVEGGKLTSIGTSAFSGCSSLETILIPSQVSNISNGAFSECGSLTAIYVDSNNASYACSDDGVLFSKDMKTLICFPGGLEKDNYEIPDTVTAIENYAFKGCTALGTVTWPATITTISYEAFRDSSITSIDIPDTVIAIDGYAFYGCKNLTSVNLPTSITTLGYYAFACCTGLESIEIPEGITKIYGSTFKGCSSLKSVNLPEGLAVVYECAFQDCASLETIDIPSSVKTINKATFQGCTSLTSITIPEGVTSIGESAFEGSGLTSVELPSTLTSIGDYAFRNSKLTSVKLPDSVTSIGSGPFVGCTSLTEINVGEGNTAYASVDGVLLTADLTKLVCYPAGKEGDAYTVPDSVTELEKYAFASCCNLAALTVPDSVTDFGLHAFEDATSLNAIRIGSGAKGLYAVDFAGCCALTNVNVSDDNPNYTTKDGILYNKDCTQLIYYPGGRMDSYFAVPQGVTQIGDAWGLFVSAFSGNTHLTTVSVPEGVTELLYSFSDCSNLKTIILPKSLTLVAADCFDGCESLTDVYYLGSESDRANIEIQNYTDQPGNANLTNATWHCDHVHYYKLDAAGDISCIECGQVGTSASWTLGDINDNRRLNITDAQVVFDMGNQVWDADDGTKYGKLLDELNCGWNANTLKTVADVNGDGDVDAMDARAIQYFVHNGKLESSDLTYTAPADLVYDGTAKVATFTSAKEGVGTISAEYSADGVTWSAEAPTAVGTYQVRARVAKSESFAGQVVYDEAWAFTIAQIQLTVNGTTVADKDFDGTTGAVATLGDVSGIAEGDDVTVTATATFADASIGEDKAVTVNYSLSGDAAIKYVAPESETLTAAIDRKPIDGAAVTNVDARYKWNNGRSSLPAAAVEPTNPQLWLNGNTLARDVDYTIEYANNVNAGTATMTFTGIGNYTGTVTKTFDIYVSRSIGLGTGNTADSADLIATESSVVSYTCPMDNDIAYAYNGYISATSGAWWGDAVEFVKSLNNAGLTPSDSAMGTAGTWRLLSLGITGVFGVGDAKAWQEASATSFGNVDTLWYSDSLSTDESKAYAWSCASSGKATYSKINAKSNFGFVVIWDPAIDLSTAEVEGIEKSYDYTSEAISLSPSVTVRGKTLKQGTDYTIEYSEDEFVNAGTYTVTIKPVEGSNCVNEKTVTFTINKAQLTVTGTQIAEFGKKYDGTTFCPVTIGTVSGIKDPDKDDVEVTASATYAWSNVSTIYYYYDMPVTVKYTVTGNAAGNYIAPANEKYTSYIEKTYDFKYATITGGINDSYEWTGSPITPDPQVFIGGPKLTKGTDYEVTYENNTEIGTAKVIVTGKGNYTHVSISKEFQITKRQLYVTGTTADKVYDGTTTSTPKKGVVSNVVQSRGDKIKVLTSSDPFADASVGSNKRITVHYYFYGDDVGYYTYPTSETITASITPASLTNTMVSTVEDQVFTGSALTPVPTVLFGDTVLLAGLDYTCSYTNNTQAGTATVTVVGRGNFTGAVTRSFAITKADVSRVSVGEVSRQTYAGEALTPVPEVTLDGTIALEEGVDFTCEYANNDRPGTATVTVKGLSFEGELTRSFTIGKASQDDVTVADVADQYYTGDQVTPVPEVKIGDVTLTEGKDFTCEYANNTAVGTATVTIRGISFDGEFTKDFTIAKHAKDEVTVAAIADQQYTGSQIVPVPAVTLGKTVLAEGKDFTYSYGANTAVGEGTVTVTGITFDGTFDLTFNITQRQLTVSGTTVADKDYDGTTAATATLGTVSGVVEAEKEGVTVTPTAVFKDASLGGYKVVEVSYAVSGTAADNYIAPVTETLKASILGVSIDGATIEGIESSYAWTGNAIEPEPAVTLDGSDLVEGTDYLVSYADNADFGTATVTVVGIGKYYGSVTKTFAINATYTLTGGNAGGKVLDVASLLDTESAVVGYTSTETSRTVYAYNGYISATAGAIYADASAFVGMLNDAGVTPKDSSMGTHGSWRLLKATEANSKDAKAWQTATFGKGGTGTFDYVSYLWSEGNHSVGKANCWLTLLKACGEIENYWSISYTGFVVVWEPFTNIESATVEGIEASYFWTGSAIEPDPTVTLGETVLEKDKDYTVTYDANVKAGTARVVITGIGDYAGTITKTFEIGVSITTGVVGNVVSSAGLIASESNAMAYYSPYNKKTVYAYTDYISITRRANLSEAQNFVKLLNQAGVTPGDSSKGWNGTWRLLHMGGNDYGDVQAFTNAKNAKYGGRSSFGDVQRLWTDYPVSNWTRIWDIFDWYPYNAKPEWTTWYNGFVVIWVPSDNLGQGTAGGSGQAGDGGADETKTQLTVSGTTVANKFYDGTTAATAKVGTVSGIAEGDDVSVTATASFASADAGKAKVVSVTYALSGNDADKYVAPADETLTATVVPAILTAKNICSVESQVFTGSAITPVPAVVFDATALLPGTDYTCSYKNNRNLGTGTVTVSGKGNFSGSASTTFVITRASDSGISVDAIGDQAYTGTALTPVPTVTLNGTNLENGTDFTCTYANNVMLGTGTVTVTGKSFEGEFTVDFAIKEGAQSSVTVAPIDDQQYTGGQIAPTPTVKIGDKTLTEGTDFEYSYGDNTELGTGTVTVKGITFDGSVDATFNIVPRQLTVSGTTVSDKVYDETTDASATVGTVSGIADRDKDKVTVTPIAVFEDDNVGTSKVVTVSYEISGDAAGNYIAPAAQSLKASITYFRINDENADVTGIDESYAWTGEAIKPVPVVKLGEKTLAEGTDYEMGYANNVNDGTATVTIVGIGKYGGTTTRDFAINASYTCEGGATLSAADLLATEEFYAEYTSARTNRTAYAYLKFPKEGTSISADDLAGFVQMLNEAGVKPKDSSRGAYGTWCLVDASEVPSAGAGSLVAWEPSINIEEGATVTIKADSYAYTGSAITPEPTVALGEKTLTKGTDYTVSYYNNTYAGTAHVIITGIGDYTGTITKDFEIYVSYKMANGKVITSTGLLNTESVAVAYSSPFNNGKTCYSYSGYIYTCIGANGYDALNFKDMLNKAHVLPRDAAEGLTGYWRLMKGNANNNEEALAWHKATFGSLRSAKIGGRVTRLWADDDVQYPYWLLQWWTDGVYATYCDMRYPWEGINSFVVVWNPTE